MCNHCEKFAKYSTRGIAVRLFITCWLIYSLHFATNIVREIYPVLALVDRLSFRLDEYADFHPDIFLKPGYGWHINNNPGVSFFAAVPYFFTRPIIEKVVNQVNETRRISNQVEPPAYQSPWPLAQKFYSEAWKKGLDIKLGLVAFVTQTFFMAPLTALSAVSMFLILSNMFKSDKVGLFLSLLYAFGTPVFFRTGTLNQNLSLGIIAFLGFLVLWNQGGWINRISPDRRLFLGGLAGGIAILFDYSGFVYWFCLFVYALIKSNNKGPKSRIFSKIIWFSAGSFGPLALLWLYQYLSFGNPFLPAQTWMQATQYSNFGYQGMGYPMPDLLIALLVDFRYGLIVSSPIMLLAFIAPFMDRGVERKIPRTEMLFIFSLFFALLIFFSANNYSRLQFNSGVRYLTGVVPFLFLPVAVVLMRLPVSVRYLVSILTFYQSWSLAMYRDVENSLGVFDSMIKMATKGLQLPALVTISRLPGQFSSLANPQIISIIVIGFALVILLVIWSPISLSKKILDCDNLNA